MRPRNIKHPVEEAMTKEGRKMCDPMQSMVKKHDSDTTCHFLMNIRESIKRGSEDRHIFLEQKFKT
jgi:hypothetical protein